jgi:hypothetical protein
MKSIKAQQAMKTWLDMHASKSSTSSKGASVRQLVERAANMRPAKRLKSEDTVGSREPLFLHEAIAIDCSGPKQDSVSGLAGRSFLLHGAPAFVPPQVDREQAHFASIEAACPYACVVSIFQNHEFAIGDLSNTGTRTWDDFRRLMPCFKKGGMWNMKWGLVMNILDVVNGMIKDVLVSLPKPVYDIESVMCMTETVIGEGYVKKIAPHGCVDILLTRAENNMPLAVVQVISPLYSKGEDYVKSQLQLESNLRKIAALFEYKVVGGILTSLTEWAVVIPACAALLFAAVDAEATKRELVRLHRTLKEERDPMGTLIVSKVVKLDDPRLGATLATVLYKLSLLASLNVADREDHRSYFSVMKKLRQKNLTPVAEFGGGPVGASPAAAE